MFCKSCGKQLPDESQFCPYCMTKFGEEKAIEPAKPTAKPKSKKLPAIIVAAVLCVALVVTGIVVIPKLGKGKDPNTGNISAGVTPQGEGKENNDKNKSGTKGSSNPAKDKALGLMNVKIQDSKDLDETQKLMLQYFDKDYFRAPYNSLQRYPQVYKNAQINFLCYVTKIIETNAEEYTALVEYEAYKVYEGEYVSTGAYAVIKGKQTETRIMEGDSLYIYGKYVDVNSYTVDGKSYTVPTVLVNRYTYFYFMDYVKPMYSMEEIRSIARYVFGNDLKLRSATVEEVGEDSGYDPEWDVGTWYTVELDNQSNANFTKYLFFAGWGGDISDLKSEYPVERNLIFSADFQNFYVEVFDRSLKVYTLECYDRSLKKLWSREFDQTTSSVIDYTKDHIYLVANGSMYIINTKTGENDVEPKYVGAKTAIRKLEDGILLISHKASDAIMKTDLTGNVLWTANLSFDMTDPMYGGDAPLVQIIGGNYVIQYYPDVNQSTKIHTAVITPDGTVDFDGEAF